MGCEQSQAISPLNRKIDTRVGLLKIKVQSIHIDHITGPFSEMDPYIVLKLTNQQHQTKIKQKAGVDVVYDQNFEFFINSCYQELGRTLGLEVWDKNRIGRSQVGYGIVDLTPIIDNWGQQQSYKPIKSWINYDGSPAGYVMLSALFIESEYEMLNFKFHRATIRRNTRVIGDMNCYIKVIIGEQQLTTSKCKDTKQLPPTWTNQTLTFRAPKLDHLPLFTIELHDEDNVVGKLDLKFEDFFQNSQNKQIEYNYDLYHEREQAATVRFSLIRGTSTQFNKKVVLNSKLVPINKATPKNKQTIDDDGNAELQNAKKNFPKKLQPLDHKKISENIPIQNNSLLINANRLDSPQKQDKGNDQQEKEQDAEKTNKDQNEQHKTKNHKTQKEVDEANKQKSEGNQQNSNEEQKEQNDKKQDCEDHKECNKDEKVDNKQVNHEQYDADQKDVVKVDDNQKKGAEEQKTLFKQNKQDERKDIAQYNSEIKDGEEQKAVKHKSEQKYDVEQEKEKDEMKQDNQNKDNKDEKNEEQIVVDNGDLNEKEQVENINQSYKSRNKANQGREEKNNGQVREMYNDKAIEDDKKQENGQNDEIKQDKDKKDDANQETEEKKDEEPKETKVEDTEENKDEEPKETKVEETEEKKDEEPKETKVEDTEEKKVEETEEKKDEEPKETKVEDTEEKKVEETEEKKDEEPKETKVEDTEEKKDEEPKETKVEDNNKEFKNKEDYSQKNVEQQQNEGTKVFEHKNNQLKDEAENDNIGELKDQVEPKNDKKDDEEFKDQAKEDQQNTFQKETTPYNAFHSISEAQQSKELPNQSNTVEKQPTKQE